MATVDVKEDNGVINISVRGRIDSSNADEFGRTILKVAASPDTSVILDFNDLEYISSAGLRVLLTLRKTKEVQIVNVNSQVYEVLEMTGLTEIFNVRRAIRTLDISECEKIGEGAYGIILKYGDDEIIKAYKQNSSIEKIEKERDLARQALIMGVPTAISFDIVKIGDYYGSVYELIDAKSMSNKLQENPQEVDKYVDQFNTLLKEINNIKVSKEEIPNAIDKVYVWLKDCEGHLDEAVISKLKDLIEDLKDSSNLLHFDFHTNNILIQNGEPLIIDMDTMCKGDPLFELVNIYITYVLFGATNPEMVENFLGIPYELATEFWNKFIRKYLKNPSEDRVEQAMNKIKLLSNVRQLRHYARRSATDPKSLEAMEYSKQQINELIDKVDSLKMF